MMLLFLSFCDAMMPWNTNSYANDDINRKISFFWLLMPSIRWKIVGDWIGLFGGAKMGNWYYPRKQREMKLIVQRDEQIQSSTQIFMTPSMGVVRMQKWNVYKVHIQIRELLSSWIFLYIRFIFILDIYKVPTLPELYYICILN